MNRLKLYIFQFGQVATSLAGIIQKFTCCRLFKQQEWGKEVDAEMQQNQADLKMFVKFKNNFFPREILFLDRTHQGKCFRLLGVLLACLNTMLGQ